MAGLVAELRRTAADPDQPQPLRLAAARRLRRLAGTDLAGRALAPAADPATWWGLRDPSLAPGPLRPADEPVTVSASTLEGLLTCPAQWFLRREAGGATVSSASQGFGTIVHAVAEQVVSGALRPAEDEHLDVDRDLMPHVDAVWDRMDFRTPWSGQRERAAVRDVLARFLAWHEAPGARTVLCVEPRMAAEVTLPSGERVRLHGYADRLELDEDGRVVVVDLKTGKYPPTNAQVAEHPQLGLYQLAVDHGAAEQWAPGAAAGGAELVQLRHGAVLPKVQRQPADEPGAPRLVEEQLDRAVRALRAEELPARPGTWCERCEFWALCPDKTSGSVLS